MTDSLCPLSIGALLRLRGLTGTLGHTLKPLLKSRAHRLQVLNMIERRGK